MAFFPDEPTITGADVQPIFSPDITRLSTGAAVIGNYNNGAGQKYTDLGLSILPTGLTIPLRDGNGRSGTIPITASTASRPVLTGASAGYIYFDTTLVLPIFWTGTGWVKADGTPA